MERIRDNVIIVTGGASGLGRAASLLLAANGARIVVADRNEAGARATAEQIGAQGGEAIHCAVDIAEEQQVKAMVALAVERYGRLDHALNNAAIANAEKILHEISAEEFMARQNVNLFGTFLCMKYEITAMLEKGRGTIVNVSSTSGVRGTPRAADYGASKFGIIGLTQCAAIDYAGSGIRVNAIAPGPMDTPMIAKALQQPGWAEWVEKNTPMKRYSDPVEQARAVMWLMSDASSFVTGICMPVDGGFLAS
jgi:2,5-dichloro-2,5-cyclohexadiene-1,4-diol dehydrogenase 1